MVEYNKRNVPLAKVKRKNMTPQERKLWHLFLKTYPIRFQRQKAIGNYIVDFYCAKAKLIIELDGGGHYAGNQPEKDFIRTEHLEQSGFRVVRFLNTDVDKNFENVCQKIDLEVKKSLPQSPAATAPSSEGAETE